MLMLHRNTTIFGLVGTGKRTAFGCIQDRIIIMASIIKANQLQDFGGNSILTSDGAGNLTTQKTNYPAFVAYLFSPNSFICYTTKVQFDTKVFDTNTAFDNSTNYRFTPGVAGKYFIIVLFNEDSADNNI